MIISNVAIESPAVTITQRCQLSRTGSTLACQVDLTLRRGLVASCHGSPAPPDGPGPDVDGLDVLISSTRTVVYVGFTNPSHGDLPMFPQLGACATSETDGTSLEGVCFSDVLIAGTPLSTAVPQIPMNPFSGGPITGDTTITLRDCDRTATAPIHLGALPTIDSYTAHYVGDDLVITWSAPGASHVLVGGYPTFCLDGPSGQRVFPGYGPVRDQVAVALQALREPDVTSTELGDFRVWSGETVYVTPD